MVRSVHQFQEFKKTADALSGKPACAVGAVSILFSVSILALLLLVACERSERATLAETVSQINLKEHQWQSLSRIASIAYQEGKMEQAQTLMQTSVEAARQEDVPPLTLLSLRCKLYQLTFHAGKVESALKQAQHLLTLCTTQSWQEQFVIYRILEVEKNCFIAKNRLDSARDAVSKMCELDDTLMSPSAVETARRRIDLVQMDFLRGDFPAVIANGEWINRHLKELNCPQSGSDCRLLVYMGVAYLQLGRSESGMKFIRSAASLARQLDFVLPETDVQKLRSLKGGHEIHQLLVAWRKV
ncbi:MAG: hypothetical protein K2Z81_17260 [Cyanobacteria bacterium]|nr:hypothetical protein [Cyanobacteriota bacterium]